MSIWDRSDRRSISTRLGLRTGTECATVSPQRNFERVLRFPRLKPGHQFGNGHSKGGGKQFEIANADFLTAIFEVRDKASVHANMFRHIDLCPPLSFAQGAYPLAKLNANVAGHACNYGCRL